MLKQPGNIDYWQTELAAEMRLMQHLQQAIPQANRAELAELLRLDYTEEKTSKPTPAPQIDSIPSVPASNTGQTVLQTKTSTYPATEKIPFLYLSQIAFKEAPEPSIQVPDWYAATETFEQTIDSPMGKQLPDIAPLVTWENFWPQVHHLFKNTQRIRRLDMPKVIQKVSKQQPFKQIPWQQKSCWPTELILVIDYSGHLSPWYTDFKQLAQHLLKWFGQRIQLVLCLNAERQEYVSNNQRIKGFPDCPDGAQILYLGDMGLLDQQGLSVAQWIDWAQKLWQRGVKIQAMLTAHPDGWRQMLQQYVQLSPINPQHPLEPMQQSQAQAEKLLAYLSLAFEINPMMVRQARQALGYGLSSEILALQNPALSGNQALYYQWQSPQDQKKYRDKCGELDFDQTKAWALIQAFEKSLPVELQAEQRQQAGQALNADQRNFVRKVLKSSKQETVSEQAKQMLLDWVERMVDRGIYSDWSDQDMLALYALHLKERPNATIPLPKKLDPNQLPTWLKDKQAASHQVVLRQHSNQLHLVEKSQADKTPGVAIAEFNLTGEGAIQCKTHSKDHTQALLRLGGQWTLPDDTHSIILDTRQQRLQIDLQTYPAWAEAIGRDQYGLYAEIKIATESFKMRWIPPGEFMMGSPENEPERWSAEGPQHRVEFKQGYWLAETTCIQALWQAVMGENPSEFKDNPQNPVENVNWQMAQDFIRNINQQISGLNLRLPSEAEWEYACRAGTTTAFWWGDALNTDLANYDGNHPYNGGEKGEYRKKTLPVNAFQANPWGLYQMHGNVWEWCQDKWHSNYQGAPADGQVWETGDSQYRVCRGGSWFHDGRYLRSAFRHVGWRVFDYLGLRLARGPDEP